MGQTILVPTVSTIEVALVKVATAISCTLLEPASAEECVATPLGNSEYLDRTAITSTTMAR